MTTFALRLATVAALAWGALAPAHALAPLPPEQLAQAAAAPDRKPPPDLPTQVSGVYVGEIISDSRGTSSAVGHRVTLTITRIDARRIRIESSDPYLPGADIALQAFSGTVVHASGKSSLFMDFRVRPAKIDYSWQDQVSFAGTRE